jgi:NAD(P)-dependent dehydrogenase (short-subunit alcohol dehydrogenase family)
MNEPLANTPLAGKTVLITGGARRIGRHLALTAARAGANIVVHHAHSPIEAQEVCTQARQWGVNARTLTADLNDLGQVSALISAALCFGPLDIIINNAAIFEPRKLLDTTLNDWLKHLNTNLTAPFLISRDFASSLPEGKEGRIVNILDWRALRPGPDHFPYTISKAGLAAMTQSMAAALAPRILVNGLAFGAILLPSDNLEANDEVLQSVPAGRWATLDEVGQALLFLLGGPSYITGEIIHLDGGRHLI